MSAEPTTTVVAARARRRRPVARPSPGVLAAVAAGGALGSLGRYELALAAPVKAGVFPWTTFWINVTGSVVLGAVVTLVIERWPPTRYVRPFVGVGICGGYTTWSAFMTESALLIRDRHFGLVIVYLVASVVAGLAATFAGIGLARLGRAQRRRST